MKKFLYIMPSVLTLMLYGLLSALAGGFGGFQLIAYVYMGLPLVAGILLQRGKWWGCLFGIAMGGILLYTGRNVMIAFVAGLVLVAYYIAMGLVCAASRKEG